MQRFLSLTSPTFVIALSWLMAGGFPGPVQGQVSGDDPYYDPAFDPYYSPGFDSYIYYDEHDESYDAPYEDPHFEYYDYGQYYHYGYYIETDPEIRSRIINTLELSPYVDRERIQVSVENGIATLSGRVEDRSEMVDAVEIAYEAGAWRVRNKLRPMDALFRPWARMDDRELQKEIEQELAFSPFVNANRVTVSVENGVATLYGGVENKGEIANAVENAYEAGAKRVKSRMWVDAEAFDLF